LVIAFWFLFGFWCFGFVSDFVLRISDLLDGWTFASFKALR